MHFGFLPCTLQLQTLNSTSPLFEKKKIHLQSSLVHIVPAHMVSVGVSLPKNPLIGCEETASNRLWFWGLLNSTPPDLRFPIDPRRRRLLCDSKGRQPQQDALREARRVRKERAPSVCRPLYPHSWTPANVHTHAFPSHQLEGRTERSPIIDPWPRDPLKLHVQSPHSTDRSEQKAGSGNDL